LPAMCLPKGKIIGHGKRLNNMTLQTTTDTKKTSTFLWVILVIYAIVLVEIILIKEPHHFWQSLKWTWRHGPGSSYARANFKLLYTIRNFYHSGSNEKSWVNVGGNILLFIPFGILVPIVLRGKYKIFATVVLAFLLSLAFELFQLFTGCGYFDVDDIFLNTLGGVIGVIIYVIATSFSVPEIRKKANALG